MFVRDAGQARGAADLLGPRRAARHFPCGRRIRRSSTSCRVRVPDRMDIWRIRPTGGAPERITYHDSRVSHPVFLDARTLLYLATDADGSGPWLHSLDVERRMPHRVSFGIDRYTSLAASADGRRLVATLASPKGTLWRAADRRTRAPESSAARRIPLTTGSGSLRGSAPVPAVRLLQRRRATASGSCRASVPPSCGARRTTRIIGAPAIARDGGASPSRPDGTGRRRCTSRTPTARTRAS